MVNLLTAEETEDNSIVQPSEDEVLLQKVNLSRQVGGISQVVRVGSCMASCVWNIQEGTKVQGT